VAKCLGRRNRIRNTWLSIFDYVCKDLANSGRQHCEFIGGRIQLREKSIKVEWTLEANPCSAPGVMFWDYRKSPYSFGNTTYSGFGRGELRRRPVGGLIQPAIKQANPVSTQLRLQADNMECAAPRLADRFMNCI
jgi:hypothetical protein